jgi:hypothetical protein
MKPVDYLRSQSLPVLALVLAYQRVMRTRPAKRAPRTKPAGKQLKLEGLKP